MLTSVSSVCLRALIKSSCIIRLIRKKQTLCKVTRLRSNNSPVCLLVRQAFHNCTCVGEMMTPGVNMSTVLGQCSRKSDCDRIFKIYMALSVLGSFISACGGTPGYMVLLRSVIIRHSVQASRQLTGILFLNTCADLPGPFSRT